MDKDKCNGGGGGGGGGGGVNKTKNRTIPSALIQSSQEKYTQNTFLVPSLALFAPGFCVSGVGKKKKKKEKE